MLGLLALLLAATLPAPADHPQTYLLSIVGIPLKTDEALDGFSIATWGVRFNAVCHIPPGWTIKAGSSATPEGVLEGEASLGTTWLRQASPKELHDLVLITLYEPVQRRDIGNPGGDYVPATFKGKASISIDDGDRHPPLTFANLRLTKASRCPTAAR